MSERVEDRDETRRGGANEDQRGASPSEANQEKRSFPIVGIGASAGGLKAFEAFLRNTPAESGMAFVLVQHLDPNHRSELAELLQNHTSMPVTQVEDSPEVEPNCVYIIPPNKHLEISKGKLQLSEREQRGSHVMIDLFFRSLAEDQGRDAICVILSGTGTDGTQGLKAIKEKGGLTFAQSEEDAQYDGMPRSAAATGLVDFVLDVAQIPKKLMEVKHAETLELPDGESKLLEDDADTLQKVCAQLRSKTGHDFSYYSKSASPWLKTSTTPPFRNLSASRRAWRSRNAARTKWWLRRFKRTARAC